MSAVLQRLDGWFGVTERGSTVRTELRAGVYTGEVELRGDDVGGR